MNEAHDLPQLMVQRGGPPDIVTFNVSDRWICKTRSMNDENELP